MQSDQRPHGIVQSRACDCGQQIVRVVVEVDGAVKCVHDCLNPWTGVVHIGDSDVVAVGSSIRVGYTAPGPGAP